MSDEEIELFIYLIWVGLILFFVWIVMFVFGFGIFVVIIGSCVFVVLFFIGWVFKIVKEIDDEYENCKSIVLRIICIYFLKYFVELFI